MSSLKMPNINRVEIAGRLVRDAEFRTTSGGMEFGKFSVAVSRKSKGKEETYWASVMLWGRSIEWLRNDLRKGRSVYVAGRLGQYVDKDKKTHTQITADDVQLLDWPDDGRSPSQEPPRTRETSLDDMPSYGPPDTGEEDLF